MIEKVKEMRVSIDALIQVTQELGIWNDNVKDCIRSLRLGKMWLGKALGQMGDETPYQQGNDTSNNVIDPKADRAEIFGALFDDIDMTNQIQLAKKLREEIEKEIAKLGLMFSFNNTSTDLGMYANHSRLHLCEARMWLGEFLSQCKDRSDKANQYNIESAKNLYASYVASITPNSAPGTKFDDWTELSQFQKTAWMAVAESGSQIDPLR